VQWIRTKGIKHALHTLHIPYRHTIFCHVPIQFLWQGIYFLVVGIELGILTHTAHQPLALKCGTIVASNLFTLSIIYEHGTYIIAVIAERFRRSYCFRYCKTINFHFVMIIKVVVIAKVIHYSISDLEEWAAKARFIFSINRTEKVYFMFKRSKSYDICSTDTTSAHIIIFS
jgi:hypothetical protein